MFNSETTEFKKGIRITEDDYNWIRQRKKKKSAAGFLKQIIKAYRDSENKKTKLTPNKK